MTMVNVTHNSFTVSKSGTILTVGCSSCNNGTGGVSVLNINNVTNPLLIYNMTGNTNLTGPAILGERAYYYPIDPNNFNLVYSTRTVNSNQFS